MLSIGDSSRDVTQRRHRRTACLQGIEHKPEAGQIRVDYAGLSVLSEKHPTAYSNGTDWFRSETLWQTERRVHRHILQPSIVKVVCNSEGHWECASRNRVYLQRAAFRCSTMYQLRSTGLVWSCRESCTFDAASLCHALLL